MSVAALEIRPVKAAIGALALVAALAIGVGATLAGSLFGGLAALALGAGAGFAAALEVLEADRHGGWRTAAWAALAAGWIVLAAMLLNRPLQDPAGLALLGSVLLVAAAALRAWRWQVQRGAAVRVLAVALGCTLLALAATGSSLLLQAGARSITVLGVGCALELFGSGSFWLGETSAARDRQRAGEKAALPVGAAIQMV